MEEMTRSGGLWPSIQVRMLTITFSPMSTRPSIVAELMCGSRTTLGRLSSFGFTAGSCSKTSSPAPASSRYSSMAASASSSMISPRAVLTMIACGRISFSRRAESRW